MNPVDLVRFFLAAVLAFAALPASALDDEAATRGFQYAVQNCAECHAIQYADYDSPFFEAPSFMEIANSPGMSEIALFPFFQTSHQLMPNFIVPADDIGDLTAYLLTLRE